MVFNILISITDDQARNHAAYRDEKLDPDPTPAKGREAN